MGYRHTMTSDTMVPHKNELPEWFLKKYEGGIDFDGEYWRTKFGEKRYGYLGNFEDDVVKMLKEEEITACLGSIRLVYFADESSDEDPDIVHVTCTSGGAKEIRMCPRGSIYDKE